LGIRRSVSAAEPPIQRFAPPPPRGPTHDPLPPPHSGRRPTLSGCPGTLSGSDRNSVRTVPDCCPDAAGILSGKLRSAVRHRPDSCPDSIGIGVRMPPEYAAGAYLCVPHADRRVADLPRHGLSAARFSHTVYAGHRRSSLFRDRFQQGVCLLDNWLLGFIECLSLGAAGC